MGPGERARGGSGDEGRSVAEAVVEVVVRNGVGLGGIELGCLIEVVRGEVLGDLVGVGDTEREGELGLGRPPCGVEPGRRAGLAGVGEDLGDRLGIGEYRDERKRRVTGGTDQREDFIDPGEEGGPTRGWGRGRWETGMGRGLRFRGGVGGEGRGTWTEATVRSDLDFHNIALHLVFQCGHHCERLIEIFLRCAEIEIELAVKLGLAPIFIFRIRKPGP